MIFTWKENRIIQRKFVGFSFKYSGDSDDKLWLYEQNELPITGGKVCCFKLLEYAVWYGSVWMLGNNNFVAKPCNIK